MKRSNIILLSLLVIALILIVVVQFEVRSYTTKIEGIDIEYNQFEKLEIQTGWLVELRNDSLTQITINNDSIKNLISQTGNTLVLNENKNGRKIISITNPYTREIDILGNSTLRYYTETSLDSLELFLNENSDIIIYNKKDQEKEPDKKIKNTIDYLNLNCSDKSSLNVYTNINSLEGFLNDTSFLYIRGKFKIKSLEKAEEARINSW